MGNYINFGHCAGLVVDYIILKKHSPSFQKESLRPSAGIAKFRKVFNLREESLFFPRKHDYNLLAKESK